MVIALLVQGCQREAPSLAEDNIPVAPPPAVQTTNAVAVESTNAPPETATTNAPPEVVTTNAPAPAPAVPTEYTIVPGDTFTRLARSFHTTVKALMDANPGVEPAKLQIGQKLHLPQGATAASAVPASADASVVKSGANTGEEPVYVVKSGDCLIKIASQFGTTVSALREANGLKTDLIAVGQKLKLPAKLALPGTGAGAPTSTGATNAVSNVPVNAGSV